MYKVSKQYLERIYSGGAKSKAKIKFNGVELEDANRLIEKITIKRRILANGSERFSLDNFIATEIEMILHNVSLDTIKEPVDISIGTLVGDTYEYVPIGIFKIEGSPTTDKDKTTLQLRDNAIKFDFNYNAQPVIDNNGGSATLKQIFNNICELAEVETDVTSFNGEDLKFGIFDNTITARQYISYIAEQAGMMATIDRTGKLTFVDLNSDSAQIISGKTVTFDSELERSLSFQVNGNTEQTTYSGKNLLNYIDSLQSISGLTNTLNPNGSITTTGKPTANYTRIVKDYDITNLLEDGQKYTISQTDTSLKTMLQIAAYKNDGTITYYSSRNGANVLTINKSIYTKFLACVQTTSMSLWGDSSLTITNKYMLCKGTDTVNTSFEPYVGGQASPNPDYPQEIKNIKGVENIWFGGESTTNNGITFTKNADGSYDITGTATAQADCINLVNIANTKLKNGINYNLSINKLTNEKVSILTEAYIENWDSHVIGPLITSTTLSTNKIINIKDNITRVRYVIRVEKGQTVNIKGLKIQLEEGTIAHTFVLPGSNYLQLEDKTENLIGLDNKQYRVNLKKGDKIIAANNGTTNLNLNLYTNYGDTVRNDFFTIAANSQRPIVIVNDSNAIAWGGTLDNIAWVVKGEKFIPYEPYKSESTLIDLKGNELCSNKDKTVKDNLFVTNRGKVEIFKKIGKVVLDGVNNKFQSKHSTITSDTKGFYRLELPNKNKSIYYGSTNALFSNYFLPVGIANSSQAFNSTSNGIWWKKNTNYCYVILEKSTLEEANNLLKAKYDAGQPVIIQYELENPQTIELDTVTPLKSYIGQNNISNNADADMNVTYDLKRQPFEIPTRIVESLEKDETYKIGRVEYEDALRKFEQGEQDDYLYINSANPYISNQKQISDIYELLNGYSIDTFKTGKIIGNPALDGYDLIKFVYKDKEYITLNQGTLTFNGVMIQTNETTIGTEAKQSNVTVKSQAAKFKRAFTEIDAVNAQVKITTEQTNTIQDNLTNNYYTIEQSNTLIQNAQSGLTNTFSGAGGNNIFRNTGLWFSQSDTDNPYEYWTGKNVSRQNTDKSSNGSLMMLKKGTLEQEQVVSNGNYTVSFKYKKLIQLATCKVIVNDNEYELTQMTDTEWQTDSKDADGNIVIKPLEVTSNHINVKFTSTVDNAIEIYDLMVNAGTVKLAYSQNENEVTTDTVNISKGITITSSANDTKFKANADGIRIVDKNNEKTILTEFTDKGMSTKEMEVENGATIVKVLVQNVGSQTWFTRI